MYISHFFEDNSVVFWTHGLVSDKRFLFEHQFPMTETLIQWGEIGQQSYYIITEIENIQQALYLFDYKTRDYMSKREYLLKIVIPSSKCSLQEYLKQQKIRASVNDCGQYALIDDENTLILLNLTGFRRIFENCKFDENTSFLFFELEEDYSKVIMCISVKSRFVVHEQKCNGTEQEQDDINPNMIDILALKDVNGKSTICMLHHDRINYLSYDDDKKPPSKSVIHLGMDFNATGFFKFTEGNQSGEKKIAVWGGGTLKILQPGNSKIDSFKYTQVISKVLVTKTHYIVYSFYPIQFEKYYVCTENIQVHPRLVFQSPDFKLQKYKNHQLDTYHCDNYGNLCQAKNGTTYNSSKSIFTIYLNASTSTTLYEFSHVSKDTARVLKTVIYNGKMLFVFGDSLYKNRKVFFADVVAQTCLTVFPGLYEFEKTMVKVPKSYTFTEQQKLSEDQETEEYYQQRKKDKYKRFMSGSAKAHHLNDKQKVLLKKFQETIDLN